MQRKLRDYEFKVAAEFNLARKPSFLTWSQFYSELSAIQLTLQFPANELSRFTITALSPPQQPQPQPLQQPKPQPPQRPQKQQPQQKQGRRKKRGGFEEGEEKKEGEDEDLDALVAKQLERQQIEARKQQQERQRATQRQQQHRNKSAVLQQQLQQQQQQQQAKAKEGRKIVDVEFGIRDFDSMGYLVRCAYELAYRYSSFTLLWVLCRCCVAPI